MTAPEAALITRELPRELADRLEKFAAFDRIDSTNSWLAARDLPAAGHANVAVADHQTAGRGRRDREWLSAPGASLCLSIAYSFESVPDNLPALTIALGVGVLDKLEGIGVGPLALKWPNDLMLGEAKLGGILTEAQQHGSDAFGVIAGIGLNLALPDPLRHKLKETDGIEIASLADALDDVPSRDVIAAHVITAMLEVLADYDARGFDELYRRFEGVDWLDGREIVVESASGDVAGKGAGIDRTGALLVDTASGTKRIVAGTVRHASARA